MTSAFLILMSVLWRVVLLTEDMHKVLSEDGLRRTKEEFHLECAKGKDMPKALATLAEIRIMAYELQNV